MSVITENALVKKGVVSRKDELTFKSRKSRALYHCFICNRKLNSSKSSISHIVSESHVRNTIRFNKYIKIIPPINPFGRVSLSCHLCNQETTWQEVVEHVTTHNVIPWLKPDDLCSTLFRHFISVHNDRIYRCNLCNFSFGDWFHVLEHIKNSKHIKKWNQTPASKANLTVYEESTEIEIQLLITNRIFIGKTQTYRCLDCNLSFNNATEASSHTEGIEHAKLKVIFLNKISEFKYKIPEYLEWIKKSFSYVVMEEKIYCTFCDIYMVDFRELRSHLKNHKRKNMEQFHSPEFGIPLTESDLVVPPHLKWMIHAHGFFVEKKYLYCTVCKLKLTTNSVVEIHLETHLQKKWIKKNIVPKSGKFNKGSSSSGAAGTSRTAKKNAKSTDSSERTNLHRNSQAINTLGIPELLESGFPPLKSLGDSNNLSGPSFHSRPNLNDSMNIPPLMGQSVKPSANQPSKWSAPIYLAPMQNQLVNNQPLLFTSTKPVPSQTHDQLVIRPNSMNNHPVRPAPSKLNSQTLKSNNTLLNTKNMIKLHKADYLFFSKIEIYEIPMKRKRRIILSSQLSFFVKDTLEYSIYCVVCEKSIPYNLQNVYEHWRSPEHNDSLSAMKKDHQLFSIYPSQFSCLALSKEFLIENQSDELASESDLKEFICCACDVTVQDQDALLRQHFRSGDHQSNAQILRRHSEKLIEDLLPLVKSSWYNIEKYTCWPCQKTIAGDVFFAEHLKSKKHLSTMQALEIQQRKKYSFDSCVVCGILWFGDQDEYPKHCSKDVYHKKWTKSIEDRIGFLPEEAGEICTNPEMIISELVQESDKVILDREKDSELIKSLELVVKKKFPKAKAHPFGSRITGLGFTTSDIDIFLDCGGVYNGKSSHGDDLIDKIHHCFKLDPQAWSVDRVVENARTPIIKVHHRYSQLKCDVSFTNGLSVENTKLLKTYLDAHPQCREMILFMKKWFSICNITGSRNIKSYAISWFVIFYLQTRDILPPVASLMQGNPKPLFISGWQVGARAFTLRKTQAEITTKELLKGFFTYYAEFDYRLNLACPLLGTVISKKDFLYLSRLPVEMKSYVERVTTETDPELFRINSPMCIQDPYDLSHNLTKSVKKKTLDRFRKLCRKSVQVLSGEK